MVSGDEWKSGWVDDWATILASINSGSGVEIPMTVYLKFHNPSIHNKYAASYQISTRQTDSAGAASRRLLKYVTIQDNYVLRCNINKDIATVKSSDLYLVILVRNNYLGQTETAYLEEYKLLTASYDSSKFLG